MRGSSVLIFWVFFDIEVETQIHSLVDHHFGFCKNYFHLISISLNSSSLDFFDFLSSWGLSGSGISILKEIFTWFRILVYLRRWFESWHKCTKFWVWNQNQCWRQYGLCVVFLQNEWFSFSLHQELVIWISSWTFQ